MHNEAVSDSALSLQGLQEYKLYLASDFFLKESINTYLKLEIRVECGEFL